MPAVLVPKRILNYTLINHPVLDEAVADEALERVQQAVEEVWSRGMGHANDRLSPAAKRWRAEFVVHDADTPAVRLERLLAVMNQLAINLRQNPPSVEAARALARGQVIYSGVSNGQIEWGMTVELQGLAPPQVSFQHRGATPAWPDTAPLIQAFDAVRDAALSASRPAPTSTPVRVRARRSP